MYKIHYSLLGLGYARQPNSLLSFLPLFCLDLDVWPAKTERLHLFTLVSNRAGETLLKLPALNFVRWGKMTNPVVRGTGPNGDVQDKTWSHFAFLDNNFYSMRQSWELGKLGGRIGQISTVKRAEQYEWPARWTTTVRPYGKPTQSYLDSYSRLPTKLTCPRVRCFRFLSTMQMREHKIESESIWDLKRNLSICITSHRSYLSLVLAGALCSVLHVPLS